MRNYIIFPESLPQSDTSLKVHPAGRKKYRILKLQPKELLSMDEHSRNKQAEPNERIHSENL